MNGKMHGRWHGPGGRGGRGPGRGGWQQADLPSTTDVVALALGAAARRLVRRRAEVTVDREEIVIVGELPPLDGEFADTEAGRADRAAAAAGRISRFRESTRDERIEIARQAEHRYQRKVAWGARLGEHVELFTVAVGAGHDPAAAARADRARHAGRLRRGALAIGCARVGGAAGRAARRRVARRVAGGDGQGGRPAGQGPDRRGRLRRVGRATASPGTAPARSRRGGRSRPAPSRRGRTRDSRRCWARGRAGAART